MTANTLFLDAIIQFYKKIFANQAIGQKIENSNYIEKLLFKIVNIQNNIR